jgi:chaperonin cofactor prefoldin
MALTISEAEAELSKAVSLEQEIAGELSELETRLTEAERTAGDRSLEARKAGNAKEIKAINDEIAKLHTQHGIIKSTHESAREAIRNARHGVNMAQGRDLRAQAAEILKEVKVRQAKTDELLKALHEHEEIAYFPQPEARAGVLLPGTIAESKTAKLAKDAAFLVHQAEITERQIVHVEPDAPTTGRKSNAIYPDATGHYPTT